MNRKECLEHKRTFNQWPKGYIENKRKAYIFHKEVIAQMRVDRPGVQIHLHHWDFYDEHYELWKDVVPLYVNEHSKLHAELAIKNGYSSRFKKGHNPPQEWREKISKANTGRKHTEEAKKKISAACKGKVLSERTRALISKAHIGVKKGPRDPVDMICISCGEHYTGDRASKRCSICKQKPKITHICKWCNKEFIGPKHKLYCSNKCKCKFYRSKK